MKGMYRVALMGMMMVGATSAQAAEVEGPVTDEVNGPVYVMNNYVAAVRVYAEADDGTLHRLGRVARGSLVTFEIPAEISDSFRIKAFPSTPTPAWNTPDDDFGVKTRVLDTAADRRITVWLEADLTKSLLEVDRG